MWLAFNSDAVTLKQMRPSNTVFIPADNPKVVAIGARDVDYTSNSSLQLGPTLTNPTYLVAHVSNLVMVKPTMGHRQHALLLLA